MSNLKQTRITITFKQPNPLFEKWLTEWKDKAKENNSKMEHCFRIALSSLQKYPLPLETGKDCKILHGFGDKLCSMLDEKLKQHVLSKNNSNSASLPEPQPQRKSPKKILSPINKRYKEYVPLKGSGGYAILITLYEKSLEPNYVGYMSKLDIIKYGQTYCNKSFTKADPGGRYTAWSSMKTLIEKELIFRKGSPAKFSLTTQGTELADKLFVQLKIDNFEKEKSNQAEVLNESLQFTSNNNCVYGKEVSVPSTSKMSPPKPSTNHSLSTKQSSNNSLSSASQSSTKSNLESIILAPNSFEIILLVDNSEHNGRSIKSQYDTIVTELIKLGVTHQLRNLTVGDYIWICKDTMNNCELVLPYVIERKRMDDFGSSIKDGRFHEQKFRLKQCGIENLIYLVENYGNNEYVGLPVGTLYQAAINTMVQDGFTIKFTDSLRGTAKYLACLTNYIRKQFMSKTVVSCPKENLSSIDINDDLVCLMHFAEFNQNSVKTKQFKVRELFIQQLLQIKGMAVDQAQAVVKKYETPRLLKMAYKDNPGPNGEKLLANIKYGMLRKEVGLVLSAIIYQFYAKIVFN